MAVHCFLQGFAPGGGGNLASGWAAAFQPSFYRRLVGLPAQESCPLSELHLRLQTSPTWAFAQCWKETTAHFSASTLEGQLSKLTWGGGVLRGRNCPKGWPTLRVSFHPGHLGVGLL